MTIRVVIAEDERLAREELIYLLQQIQDVELVGTAANGRELLQLVEQTEPDLVILDIKMPELEGVQAARMLMSRKQQPLLVFSTAYDQFAIEAFALNAVDYLLKPFEPQRLQETFRRVRNRLTDTKSPVQKLSKLLVEENNRVAVIDPASILYAFRDERLVQICTSTECYSTKLTLQQLEEKLQGYPFFRTHKSYLVNLDYVSELTPWFNGAYNLTLKTGKPMQIPVSRSYAKELLKRLGGAV
ncbi:LytR/AlgR family response regulator transcription factor [Brevibacillus fulvus]|uniref:Two-component system response regulator LytT n=1 Tax=Brevibacillus fulvus TaxID=1125967 RepID=A0A938XVI5_9BACL|nr:LytTR family DNA-binding domain-containing protein [Brevibacillus fulvus]MBM7588478.1 two-component system response regulator LytT [Brevibacillus fulvus]